VFVGLDRPPTNNIEEFFGMQINLKKAAEILFILEETDSSRQRNSGREGRNSSRDSSRQSRSSGR